MTTETVNVTVTSNGNGNAKTATTMTTTTTTTVNGNADAAAAAAGGKNTETQKKNRIQVSNTKKPLFFYVNLAKRYIQQHNEVELSALGMAITTVVTIAEILKNNGLAIEKKVITSTVGMKDETRGRLVQKAKIEIVLEKTEKFDSLVTNNTATAAAAPATDQSAATENGVFSIFQFELETAATAYAKTTRKRTTQPMST